MTLNELQGTETTQWWFLTGGFCRHWSVIVRLIVFVCSGAVAPSVGAITSRALT